MPFDSDKQGVLQKKDKSKKGDVDPEIKEIITLFNQHRDYFTTSSCAGRSMVYALPSSRKKHEAVWLLVSHSGVTLAELQRALVSLPEDPVWVKFEPLIVHVRCRDLAAAKSIMACCSSCGLKKSGIIACGTKMMVEMIGTDFLEMLLAKEGKLLVDQRYLTCLVEELNKKHQRNSERIEKLRKSLTAVGNRAK
ncbi:hypothetical protein HYW21_05950 [Candidatus Woesearchaeota archaeon]|nr:hypothetical protein [Candidatus Woesearchaeota archaeon]